jgi:dolichol-phosphate mannosyltransferase
MNQIMAETEISIVVPSINERENLEQLIPRIQAVFEGTGISGEIIVVDDMSDDGTQDFVKRMETTYDNVSLLERTVKNGLGNALLDGVRMASSRLVLFMDADLSHDPKEIPAFLAGLRDHEVVIGSRYLKRAKIDRGLFRNWSSGGYNFIVKRLLGVDVMDITSGYRGFHAEKIMKLNLSAPGPEIHAELVLRSILADYRVTEIPVTYVDREHGQTKLNYFKIGPGYIRIMLQALAIKSRKRLG